MRKQITILGIAILLLAGCTTPRQMTLFSGVGSSVNVGTAPQYVITKGDILQITFSAINAEAVAPYNSAGVLYEVDENGDISMPVLGKVKVAGLTVDQAIQHLAEMAQSQVLKPMVRISVSNAVVTVLGEVNNPSSLSAVQPMTLIEALGRVGGLTSNAKCKDVLVQRRVDGKVLLYHINLLTNELFASPCYYLQKGDVVYVAPLHVK